MRKQLIINDLNKFYLSFVNLFVLDLLPSFLRTKNHPNPFEPKAVKNDTIPLIQEAINDWNNYTCLKLRPMIESDENYISFHTEYSGCWSFVGEF